MNGPNNYPGATSIQFSNGIITMLPPNDTPQAKKKREMLALRLKPLISGKDNIPIVVSNMFFFLKKNIHSTVSIQ